jgi:hypothetical protein
VELAALRPPGLREGADLQGAGKEVLAVIYVPTVIPNEFAREAIRCFYRSLEQPIREDMPLHFVLGARRTFTHRNVFTDNRCCGDRGRGRHWWGRLHRENETSGDLLLLDVMDMDDTRQLISSMMMKVVMSVIHAVTHYRFSYFLRGSDDVYFSFRRIHKGLVLARNLNRTVDVRQLRVRSPVRRWGVADGHYVRKLLSSRHYHRETVNAVEDSRNIGPRMVTGYLLGGAWMLSSDIAAFVAESSHQLPPFFWFEEDTNVGRLMAPYVFPFDNFRIHNFFNATKDVAHAFRGRVPLVYDYCMEDSWFIHKYPWEALRYVENSTMVMYCTRSDFGGRKSHRCSRHVLSTPSRPHRRWSATELAFMMMHPPVKSRLKVIDKPVLACDVKAVKGVVTNEFKGGLLGEDYHNDL